MSGAGSNGSRTLARGLAVLNALGSASEGATVAELSEATSLDRAVLYRLLETLGDTGFVVRDPDTRKYHLGVALVELGSRASRGLEVRRLALPGMRLLMEQSREAVCLAVRDRQDVVVVDRVEPPGLFVRVGYHVGFRHPMHVGAHGRALLAFLEAEERSLLAALTKLEQFTAARGMIAAGERTRDAARAKAAAREREAERHGATAASHRADLARGRRASCRVGGEVPRGQCRRVVGGRGHHRGRWGCCGRWSSG